MLPESLESDDLLHQRPGRAIQSSGHKSLHGSWGDMGGLNNWNRVPLKGSLKGYQNGYRDLHN